VPCRNPGFSSRTPGCTPRLGHSVPTLVRSLCRLPDGRRIRAAALEIFVSLPACQCPSFVAPPGQTQVVRQALCSGSPWQS